MEFLSLGKKWQPPSNKHVAGMGTDVLFLVQSPQQVININHLHILSGYEHQLISLDDSTQLKYIGQSGCLGKKGENNTTIKEMYC